MTNEDLGLLLAFVKLRGRSDRTELMSKFVEQEHSAEDPEQQRTLLRPQETLSQFLGRDLPVVALPSQRAFQLWLLGRQ